MPSYDSRGKATLNAWRHRFLIGFFSLLIAVPLICFGFSIRTDLKSHSVPAWNNDYKGCFVGVEAEELVESDLRIVLMVIDAWRLSFLVDNDSPMMFLRNSIREGKAVVFAANSQTPTVTMPRIKALTSGVVPTFTSIVMNFFASENSEDNWVTLASKIGKRIVFYGDDTWLRLFPKAFHEADGVTSFFVNDYTEVDNNVTRHLDRVLKSSSWNVLILHYLGLDHIGHSLGGTSSQIHAKLQEMDNIASRIVDSISVHSPLLLVVVGDHGMTNSGSHGGGSEAEIRVPMLFLHSKAIADRNEIVDDLEVIEQVDLATTLPFFLRISIPAVSVGLSLIPRLATKWRISDHSVLSAVLQSATHFSELINDSSFLRLSDVYNGERCQAAKAFAKYARSDLALQEAQHVQRRLIQSQEGVFRWPVFLGMALILLGFISLCGFHHRILPLRRFDDSGITYTLDSSTAFIFALYHLSSYSTSYVEEEHDVWYYMCSSLVVFHIFAIMRDCQKSTTNLFQWFTRSSKAKNLTMLLCLHRLATSFTSHKRRRWSLRADVLPPPLIPEFRFNVQLLDILISDFNFLSLGERVPFLVTVMCLAYTLLRIRPKHPANLGMMALPYLLSALICVQMQLPRTYGWIALCICGGSLMTFFQSVPLGVMLYLAYLVRSEMLPLLMISFNIGILTRRVSSSPYLFAFLCQTVFFYAGQSNNISSIDVAVGYKGLSSYTTALVAFQMLLNFYAMSVAFFLGFFMECDFMLSDDLGIGVAAAVLHLRSLTLFTAMSSMLCLSGHLFTFSVLAPKLICEVLNSIVTVIFVVFALLLMCLSRMHF